MKLSMKYRLMLLLTSSFLHALSDYEAEKIGKQIWLNEGSGKVEYLTYWSLREPFPSLGIGHNLWLPEDATSPYKGEFPLLCTYLQRNGVELPAWLEAALRDGMPWHSREEFLCDTVRIQDLQQLLLTTIYLQTKFMIERVDRELPALLACIEDSEKQQHVAHYIAWMRKSLAGQYALVDYWNFKGAKSILKVLLTIQNERATEQNIVHAFTASAWHILSERTSQSKNFEDVSYLRGWTNRITTYPDFK